MSTAAQILRGSMVALVTPMHESGAIDFVSLAKLIDWHIEQGTDCLVVTGTTGESPTLDHEEHVEVIVRTVQAVRARIPVIAGTGSNSTREAIDLSLRAHNQGASACLQIAPYYNRPPQSGLIAHFGEIARQVPIPHILYNVPARTGVDIVPETVVRLAEIDNIIGIKEATGSVERSAQLVQLLGPVRADFRLYAGDDATAVEVLAVGGVGSISVTANVAPGLCAQICRAAFSDNLASARELDGRLRDLHQTLFVQANPIPVKWALSQMGMIPPGIRLPLVPLAGDCQPGVLAALESAGVSFPCK